MNKEEYCKLIEQFLEEQYGDAQEKPEEPAWIPAEPFIKEKMNNMKLNSGFADATNVKRDKVKDLLVTAGNIRIGPFMIVRTKKTQSNGITLNHLFIYEDKIETHLGKRSQMTVKVDVTKDDRFTNRPWIKYFNQFKQGQNVPLDTVVEIARWLQAIRKLAAFL